MSFGLEVLKLTSRIPALWEKFFEPSPNQQVSNFGAYDLL
jgi:hypothetical protein